MDDLTPDGGHELTFGTNLGGVVQMAPGLTGAKIDDHNTVTTLVAWVGNVSNAVTRGCDGWAKVEANVIKILW